MKIRHSSYATVLDVVSDDPRTIAELRTLAAAYKHAQSPRPITWNEYRVRFQNALDYYFNKIELEVA